MKFTKGAQAGKGAPSQSKVVADKGKAKGKVPPMPAFKNGGMVKGKKGC